MSGGSSTSSSSSIMNRLPSGYHFVPTDDELIRHYLYRRAKGLRVPWNKHLFEMNIYGENAHPRSVFSNVGESCWEKSVQTLQLSSQLGIRYVTKIVYVFTQRPVLDTAARIAGPGFWIQQINTEEKIRKTGTGDVIGTRRRFIFVKLDLESERWTMDEYSLDGFCLNQELVNNDIVLCKIIWSYKENFVVPAQD